MPIPTSRPKVLLSYSRRDQAYAREFLVHSAPLRQRFEFTVWTDVKMEPGDAWRKEIASVDIAVLLVSPDYLASEWHGEYEMPMLLKRAQRGDARVIPVIVRSSTWAHTQLAYFQTLPRGGMPLDTLSVAERDRTWAEVYEALEAELHRLTEDRARVQGSGEEQIGRGSAAAVDQAVPVTRDQGGDSRSGTAAGSERPKFFISHAKEDGDFAENLQGRLRAVGLDGCIDIDVLEAGVDWRQEIDDAILASRGVILILSPDSKTSEYVTYEWAFALGSGLRIVPLMVRDTAIHPRLEIFQYLDFTNRRARPWDRLFALLKSGL